MNLEILKKYLRERLNKLAEENKALEEQLAYDYAFDKVRLGLDENVLDIDISLVASVLKIVSDDENELDRFREAQTLYGFKDIIYPEQLEKVLQYFSSLKEKIKLYQAKNRQMILPRKGQIEAERQIIEDYNQMISDDLKIVKVLDAATFSAFIKFLSNTSLDYAVVQSLILDFYQYNIDYYRQENEIKKSALKKEVNSKARKIALEIGKQDTTKIEEEDVSSYLHLEEEDRILYQQIRAIYQKLLEDYSVNKNSVIGELLKDNYVDSDHEMVYELDNNVLEAILTDLALNLLPNFKEHSKEILDIFRLIKRLYEQQIKKLEEESKYEKYVLNEENKRILDETYKFVLAKKEEYADKSLQDRNILDSMYQYILKGEADTASLLSQIYTPIQALLWGKVKRFAEVYDYFLDVINNQDEYEKSMNHQDIMAILDNYLLELKDLAKDIEEAKKDLADTLNGDDNKKDALNRQNLVVFPYNGTMAISDVMTIIKNDYSEALFRTSDALNYLLYTDYLNIGIKTHQISPVKGIPDHRDVAIPRSVRGGGGNIRVGFINLPVSQNNMNIIRNKYNLPEDFRIYLAFSIYYKTNGVLRLANSTFSKNIEEIKRIISIFTHDFDEKTEVEADNIIISSLEVIDLFKKNDSLLLKGALENLEERR